MNQNRAKHVFQKWQMYKQTRTLAFCSSVDQAKCLERYFIDQGIRAISLTSRSTGISRNEVIRKLETNEIEDIFTVDLFNEGIDIPSVDTLLLYARLNRWLFSGNKSVVD